MSDARLHMRLRVPLEGFDLDVDCSTNERVLGLFGPSGAGKTTWLETVAGLRRATGYVRCGDAVWLDSEAGVDLSPERRGIGYVPQDHLLFPHRDVRGNLRAGMHRALGRDGGPAVSLDDVVAVLELEPLLRREVGGLSGGERQRVALGRALCSGPQLLMLDEPLASLDLALRHRILPFLLRVRERFRVPMLVVSHSPTDLQALCGEVVALRQGRVLIQGPPTTVFTRADVYRTASREGFENVVPGTVVGHREHVTTLRLGHEAGGQELSVLRVERPPGAEVMIGVQAHDILVATRRIGGLSARNWLGGELEGIATVDHKRVLTVRLDGVSTPSVVIELTQDAVDELDLGVGGRLWLIVKSSSIAVYA